MGDINDAFSEIMGLFEMHGLMYMSHYFLNTNMAARSLRYMSDAEKERENVSIENEKGIIEDNELMTQNSIIIDKLYKKYDLLVPENFEELYSEENKKERYCLMISSAAILSMDSILEEQWQPLVERIQDFLNGLNTRDFISVLEYAGSTTVFAIPGIQEELKNRIVEMSDDEFFRISEYLQSKRIYPVELEEEISKRVENVDQTFIPVYIKHCHRPQDVERLMDKAKPEDRIQVIEFLIDNEKFPGVNERIINFIKSLSNIQLVRLLICISGVQFSNLSVSELLKNRIGELSKEEISLVVRAYLKSPNLLLRKEIINQSIMQGIITEENGTLYANDPIFEPEDSIEGKLKYNRYCMYHDYTGKGKDIKMLHLQFDFSEMVRRVLNGESEQLLEEELYHSMDMQDLALDVAVEKVEYIRKLEGLSDKELLVFIKDIKRFLITRQAADMLNEKNDMMSIRKNNYLQIEKYIYHRILEMKDKAAIVLLSKLYDNIGNAYFNSIIAAKYKECEGEITENFEQSDDER